jgi:hypothetical protein
MAGSEAKGFRRELGAVPRTDGATDHSIPMHFTIRGTREEVTYHSPKNIDLARNRARALPYDAKISSIRFRTKSSLKYPHDSRYTATFLATSGVKLPPITGVALFVVYKWLYADARRRGWGGVDSEGSGQCAEAGREEAWSGEPWRKRWRT